MKIIPGSVADHLMRSRPAFLDGTSSRGSSDRQEADEKKRGTRTTRRQQKVGPYASELLAAYLEQQAAESDNSVCMEDQRSEAWPKCPKTMSRPVVVKGSVARRAAVLCLERVTVEGDAEMMSDYAPSTSSPHTSRHSDGVQLKSALRASRGSDESYQSTLLSSIDESAALQAMMASSAGERPPASVGVLAVNGVCGRGDSITSEASVEARAGSQLLNERRHSTLRDPMVSPSCCEAEDRLSPETIFASSPKSVLGCNGDP